MLALGPPSRVGQAAIDAHLSDGRVERVVPQQYFGIPPHRWVHPAGVSNDIPAVHGRKYPVLGRRTQPFGLTSVPETEQHSYIELMFPKFFRPAPEFPDFELDDDKITTLISLLATHPEVSFPQLDGLAVGLAITKNVPGTDVPALLGLQAATPELLQLITQYTRDVQNTIQLDMLTPRLQNVENLETFSAWMGGVSHAVALRGIPMLHSDSAESRFIVPMILAFAQTLPNAPESLVIDQPAARNRYLKQLEGATADDLLQHMYDLVVKLMDIYNDSAQLTAPNLIASGTVRRTGPKVDPNKPCPCGSGKKYKKCHGAPGRV